MKGYILIDLEVTDPKGFEDYLKLAGPTLKQYEGKVLIGFHHVYRETGNKQVVPKDTSQNERHPHAI